MGWPRKKLYVFFCRGIVAVAVIDVVTVDMVREMDRGRIVDEFLVLRAYERIIGGDV